MRALEPEVVDVVWAAVNALLPVRVDDHPLGCHRPRVADGGATVVNDVALTALVDGTVVALRRDTSVAYARDSSGNALGGIRSPQVDVPIVALGGTKSTVQSRPASLDPDAKELENAADNAKIPQ